MPFRMCTNKILTTINLLPIRCFTAYGMLAFNWLRYGAKNRLCIATGYRFHLLCAIFNLKAILRRLRFVEVTGNFEDMEWRVGLRILCGKLTAV